MIFGDPMAPDVTRTSVSAHRLVGRIALSVFHADGTVAGKQDPRCQASGLNRQVGAFLDAGHR